jgi:hypothetical protein
MPKKNEGIRTEEDKIVQAPIKVTLGGKKYEVKPLVIKDSREWRKRVVQFLSPLPQYTNVTSDKPEQFMAALNAIMVTMPDQVTDLFFEYAKELNREEIEAIATESEVAKAFEQVVEVAFPLSQSMVTTLGVIAPKKQR